MDLPELAVAGLQTVVERGEWTSTGLCVGSPR